LFFVFSPPPPPPPAKHIIVPSEYLKSVVTRWGVKEDKIKVIYSALYPLIVDESKEELRRSFSFKTPTIVTAGRLVPWKGFQALLEVTARMKSSFPDITLVIAGDGELRVELENRIRELDLTNNVRLIGSVSKEALGATIKAADLFVLNTAYEGLSHQLLEVMDLDVPIVTTNAGGNPELITDQVHGRLVTYNDVDELGEAIAGVLANHDTRERYIVAARARVKDFKKEKVVEKFIEFIHTYE
jgi:glycosyltransferase involved in cell wall biosynthesis